MRRTYVRLLNFIYWCCSRFVQKNRMILLIDQMSSRVLKQTRLLAIVGICGLFLARAILGASIDKYIGQTIAQVKFDSEASLDARKLKDIVTVVPGEVLESAAVRESIRALYATREFSYIEVDAET